MKLPVVLHKEADSVYGITVPDIPGYFSAGPIAGPIVAESLDNVKEAHALHFEGLVADGDPLPQVLVIDARINIPTIRAGSGQWLSST